MMMQLRKCIAKAVPFSRPKRSRALSIPVSRIWASSEIQLHDFGTKQDINLYAICGLFQ
jgi:hypothetical protein